MNGGARCRDCGQPFGELHKGWCPQTAGGYRVVDDDDCQATPPPVAMKEPPAAGLSKAGLTKIGTEWFNMPLLTRLLRAEQHHTPGGSEKNFIAMLIRLVQATESEARRWAEIDSHYTHISSGELDRDAKRFSTNDVEAMMKLAVHVALSRKSA